MIPRYRQNRSGSLRPGKHEHSMDFYFLPLVQFQANVFFPLYIPNSGNEVGKVNVTES